MSKLGLICLVITLLAGCATTGESPEVGDRAPDFSLVDVSGNDIRLSDYRGKKKVVLIFYTSFQSPYRHINDCIKRIQEVQSRIESITGLNAEVIAISSMGDQQDVSRMQDNMGITFILIPKPSRKVAKAFDVWNESGHYATATVIIDKKGRIRFKQIHESTNANLPWGGYRTSAKEIIRQLQGI